MFKTKEEIEARLKEIDSAIIQQGQYVQQMNNQILMFHGAKEELNVWLNKLIEAEKKAAETAASQNNLEGGTTNDESQQ